MSKLVLSEKILGHWVDFYFVESTNEKPPVHNYEGQFRNVPILSVAANTLETAKELAKSMAKSLNDYKKETGKLLG